MAKPYTRVLAVTVSYQQYEESPAVFPLAGPNMRLVDGGGRLFLFDVDTNKVTFLAAVGLPTTDCWDFECGLAGWVDDDVYLRLKLRRLKIGDQIQYRRVDPEGVITPVESLPDDLITREVSFAKGGLVQSGGSHSGIGITTLSSQHHAVLELDRATLSPVPCAR